MKTINFGVDIYDFKTGSVKFTLNNIHSIIVDNDINNLSTKCEINIPNRNCNLTKSGDLFVYTSSYQYHMTKGKFIRVYITFNEFDNRFLFNGYISEFKQVNDLITIVCEDTMFIFNDYRVSLSYDKQTDKVVANQGTFSDVDESAQSDLLKYTGVFRETKLLDVIDDIFNAGILLAFQNYLSNTEYLIIRNNALINDINIGKIRFESKTAREILQELKDVYGLYIYFRNEYYEIGDEFFVPRGLKFRIQPGKYPYATFYNLHVGMKYYIPEKPYPSYRKSFNFIYPFNFMDYVKTSANYSPYDFNKNEKWNPIIDINSLEYEYFDKKTDLVINYISEQDDKSIFYASTIDGLNVKTVKDEVDKLQEGKKISINKKIPNLSQDTLTEICKRNYLNYPDIGFKGQIKVFGEPIIRIGDVVRLLIDRNSNVNIGSTTKDVFYTLDEYFVDGVRTIMDPSEGFVQYITLGSKIST